VLDFQKFKSHLESTKYAELEQQLEQQQQFQQQYQQQQQQFIVLKYLLYKVRDRVQDYETVIERQQLRQDELPCSSKQSTIHDSFTSRKIPEFNGTDGKDELESCKLRISEFLEQSMFNHNRRNLSIFTTMI